MFSRRHIYVLVGLLLSLTLVFVACSRTEDTAEHSDHERGVVKTGETESVAWNKVCPVCGAPVSADFETVSHEGKVYGFGCAGCPESFEENPQDYVKNLSADGTEFIGG